MLKRKILIITNPGEKDSLEDYCSGVYVDKDNYISYFTSAGGGYYDRNSEIVCLDKPTANSVAQEIASWKRLEIGFSIIIFSGHGAYYQPRDSNKWKLNKHETMYASDIKGATPKQIIIEDCCREKTNTPATYNFSNKKASVMDSRIGYAFLDPERCKRLYNKKVLNCAPQIIQGLSCDINEYSEDDDRRGGLYSRTLLEIARKHIRDGESLAPGYRQTNKYKPIGFISCHKDAEGIVVASSNNTQNPRLMKPKSEGPFLPFGIIA